MNLNFTKNKKSRFRLHIDPTFPMDNELINKDSWKKILKQKKNTAPGNDKITYQMLKHINEEALEKIIQDENNMWKKGKISKDLKSIKIIAIPKPNRAIPKIKT